MSSKNGAHEQHASRDCATKVTETEWVTDLSITWSGTSAYCSIDADVTPKSAEVRVLIYQDNTEIMVATGLPAQRLRRKNEWVMNKSRVELQHRALSSRVAGMVGPSQLKVTNSMGWEAEGV